MDKNEKVEFLEYKLHLKNREYDFLIPKHITKDIYVTLMGEGYRTFIDGNHEMYKMFRGICVALIQNQNRIIYIPVKSMYNKQNMHLKDDNGDIHPTHDLLIYCHNSQLRRSNFYKLRKQIRYTRSTLLSVKYSVSGIYDYCKKLLDKYLYPGDNKYRYKYFDGEWKLNEYEFMYFIEGSKYAVCDAFESIVDFVKNVNFEHDVRVNGYTDSGWFFGCEFGYWSTGINNHLEERKKKKEKEKNQSKLDTENTI